MNWYGTLMQLSTKNIIISLIPAQKMNQELRNQKHKIRLLLKNHWACAEDKDLEETSRRELLKETNLKCKKIWSVAHLKQVRAYHRRTLSKLLSS